MKVGLGERLGLRGGRATIQPRRVLVCLDDPDGDRQRRSRMAGRPSLVRRRGAGLRAESRRGEGRRERGGVRPQRHLLGRGDAVSPHCHCHSSGICTVILLAWLSFSLPKWQRHPMATCSRSPCSCRSRAVRLEGSSEPFRPRLGCSRPFAKEEDQEEEEQQQQQQKQQEQQEHEEEHCRLHHAALNAPRGGRRRGLPGLHRVDGRRPRLEVWCRQGTGS